MSGLGSNQTHGFTYVLFILNRFAIIVTVKIMFALCLYDFFLTGIQTFLQNKKFSKSAGTLQEEYRNLIGTLLLYDTCRTKAGYMPAKMCGLIFKTNSQ